MERFGFDVQIAKMAEKDLLYLVIKQFAGIDLSPVRVDNVQMGYVFEELIRIGAEQSNEEAGEHFTPREVIRLMVNLLLLYVAFHLPCLAVAKQEDGAALPPAGGRAAAWARSLPSGTLTRSSGSRSRSRLVSVTRTVDRAVPSGPRSNVQV